MNNMKKLYLLLCIFFLTFPKSQEIPYEKLDSISAKISQFQLQSNNLVYNDGKETYEISLPDDNFQILNSSGLVTRALTKKSEENESLFLSENIDLSKVDEVFPVQYPGSAGVVRMNFPEGIKTQIYTNGKYDKTTRAYFLEFFYDRNQSGALKSLLTQLNDLFVSINLGKKVADEQFDLKDKLKADQSAVLAEKKKNIKELNVDDLIENLTNAYGGSQKLKSIKTIYSEGTLTTQGFDMPIKTWVVNNEAMRMDMQIQGKNNTTVITKTEGWTLFRTQNQRKPVKSDEIVWKEAVEELDMTGDLFEYEVKGNTVELVGKSGIADNELYHIKVRRKNGTIVHYYLDAETFLVKRKSLNKTIEGKVVEFIETARSYKKTEDGHVYANSLHYLPANINISYANYQVNPEIDPRIFDKP